MEDLVSVLRAAGEQTRLRLLYLLSAADLTVTELTQILGQSQPRVSRHLKILVDAGLVERVPEGTWAFFRLAGPMRGVRERAGCPVDGLVGQILSAIDEDDPDVKKDRARFEQVKDERSKTASTYFSANAEEWDTIRTLHLPEEEVERALIDLFDGRRFSDLVDMGTGTGRLLELISPHVDHGIGFDTNREMLNVARANLAAAEIENCRVQYGDILSLSLPDDCADIVTVHQVLHYLSDPTTAVEEAGRLLKPGGVLIIVDFKPHDLDFLREDYAHLRLGFSDSDVESWTRAAGLEIDRVLELPPLDGQKGKNLTVGLWRARDPRLSVAADLPQKAGQ